MAMEKEKLVERLRHYYLYYDLCIKCKCGLKEQAAELVSILKEAADIIEAQGEWVSVDERLPEEHDSFFAKFYGTEKWGGAMFRKISNDVIVCIEYEDGTRKVGVAHTLDGKWNLKSVLKMKVTHWMPLPQPPKEVQ